MNRQMKAVLRFQIKLESFYFILMDNMYRTRITIVMLDGTNALLKGDSSSTQSAVVCPNPGDPDLYYIFTVDCMIDNGFSRGSNYSFS